MSSLAKHSSHVVIERCIIMLCSYFQFIQRNILAMVYELHPTQFVLVTNTVRFISQMTHMVQTNWNEQQTNNIHNYPL